MKDYSEMTDSELRAEYEKLKKQNFLLEMKDHWSGDDYKLSREYNSKLNEIIKLMDEKAGKGAGDGTESK